MITKEIEKLLNLSRERHLTEIERKKLNKLLKAKSKGGKG